MVFDSASSTADPWSWSQKSKPPTNPNHRINYLSSCPYRKRSCLFFTNTHVYRQQVDNVIQGQTRTERDCSSTIVTSSSNKGIATSYGAYGLSMRILSVRISPRPRCRGCPRSHGPCPPSPGWQISNSCRCETNCSSRSQHSALYFAKNIEKYMRHHETPNGNQIAKRKTLNF